LVPLVYLPLPLLPLQYFSMISLFEGEKIIYEARRHKIVVIIEILFLAAFKIAPILLLALFPFFPVQFDVFGSVPVLFLFLYVCWLNFIWIAIFYVWTDYYLDLWLITDRRLIMITQHGFFHRIVEEVELSKIQNVSVDVIGVVASTFDYGHIRIETAGEKGSYNFNHMARPNQVKQELLNAHLKTVQN
jgi:uncharacterized membrane protein YdbT with pleckstrin-like domain